MELMNLGQVVEEYPIFTLSALRWLLFNRDANGLSHATVKIGKRVFIDKVEFEKWIENQREKGEGI